MTCRSPGSLGPVVRLPATSAIGRTKLRCRNPCTSAQPILTHEHRRPATIPSYRSEPRSPSTGALAPINGVSANSGARVLSAVPLPARLAQWRARRWLARAATAIRGFADGASGPPDALCIRGRRAEPIGTFDAYIRPSATQRRPAAVYPIKYG